MEPVTDDFDGVTHGLLAIPIDEVLKDRNVKEWDASYDYSKDRNEDGVVEGDFGDGHGVYKMGLLTFEGHDGTYVEYTKGYEEEEMIELAKYCQCRVHKRGGCAHCYGCLRSWDDMGVPKKNGYYFPHRTLVKKTIEYRAAGGEEVMNTSEITIISRYIWELITTYKGSFMTGILIILLSFAYRFGYFINTIK